MKNHAAAAFHFLLPAHKILRRFCSFFGRTLCRKDISQQSCDASLMHRYLSKKISIKIRYKQTKKLLFAEYSFFLTVYIYSYLYIIIIQHSNCNILMKDLVFLPFIRHFSAAIFPAQQKSRPKPTLYLHVLFVPAHECTFHFHPDIPP